MSEPTSSSRRAFLALTAALSATGLMPFPRAFAQGARPLGAPACEATPSQGRTVYVDTTAKVGDPRDIVFRVKVPGKGKIRLCGHYWWNKDVVGKGRRCPAIVDFNPYRRRDGMIAVDSLMYPWFAHHGYLCFRVDLQGSGDSEGVLTDEYTDEELACCIQVIRQIAQHRWCDGNVGMMGESWGAINSLMVAAHPECPPELKAVIVNCGTDDRFADDVHYMGGAMMQDNVGWSSSMWGWLAQPPDPLVVGDEWQSMWRERIRGARYFFEHWGAHQTRDTYWSRRSVRDDYARVKVPVLIMSGWQDGYRNPVDRTVRGMTSAGLTVSGLIGPWGHRYPFSGYPGPRIDWLPHAVSHWWDKWLKGIEPPASGELPQLTVWLGRSRGPTTSPDYDDCGRWVAEDARWPERVQGYELYLAPGDRLMTGAPASHVAMATAPDWVDATAMMETSSFGAPDNDDLPDEMSPVDDQSLYFDSDPLATDFDCFGYPAANLTLTCDQPLAAIAVRLSEVDPADESVHQVTYSFFNLVFRDGDMAHPRKIEPGVPFHLRIPLNLTGHSFTQGWRIRLSISPSNFPTLWQEATKVTLTVHSGASGSLPASSLTLPRRAPRADDARVQDLLPVDGPVHVADAGKYVPAEELRAGSNERSAAPVTVGRRPGIAVIKTYDYGRYRYDGHLEGLIVDQILRENYRILDGDPGSLVCMTRSETEMERPSIRWKVRMETEAAVWSSRKPDGRVFFHYAASARTFIADRRGRFHPFEHKEVGGSIPRVWG